MAYSKRNIGKFQILYDKDFDRHIKVIAPEGFTIKITNEAPMRVDLNLLEDD